MSVRAKFKCHAITSREGSKEIELGAVTSSGEGDPNKSWSKYTPSGNLKMSITNPEAFEQFEVGKEYFLDFNPVT